MKSDWRPAFAIYLACLLAGYALMDKSFAYIGVGFIYVSEIGLLLGMLAFCLAWFQGHIDFGLLKRPSVVILAAFVLWSLSCTIPYIYKYKLYAIRDALLWGYAAFTLFILLLIRQEWLERFFRWYGYAIPFFLVWWILAFFLHWFTNIKHNPFNPAFPIFQLKSGDVAVHLSGIAAYTLFNLSEKAGIKRAGWLTWGIWLLWWANWLVYGVISRAAMLVPLVMLFILLLLNYQPMKKWGVPLLSGMVMVVLLLLTNVHLKIPDPSRKVEVSADQIAINFASLTGRSGERSLENIGITIAKPGVAITTPEPTVLRVETISWRLGWWKEIVSYTVNGPYLWRGKGYGINLAVDDGIPADPDESLRSPHNVFMTILARSGAPGLLLWCTFLLSVAFLLLKNALNQTQSKERAYAGWFLIYILANVVNGFVDVYLEGPMGGIWFWSLIGVAYLYFLPKQSSSVLP